MTRSKLAASFLTALLALAGSLAAQTTPPFAVPPPLAANALSSCGDLTVSDGVIDSQGFSSSVLGSSGNVVSNGNIKVSGSGRVNGDATAGPGKTITTSGSGTITGTKSSATTAYNCTPVDLAALTASLQSSNDDVRLPLTGQGKNPLGGSSHYDFTLSGGDTIHFPAGTYYFTKFTVSGGSVITLDGPVRILSTGSVSVSGGSFVNNNPYALRFWSSGTPFTISGGGTINGLVYAPAASATISAAHLVGSLMAQTITVSGSAHVTRVIDDVRPQVAITAPANNAIFGDGSSIVVRGTASDDQTPVTLKVNGNAVTINADGTWTTTLNLSGTASPATITALATDIAGNTGTASITIQIIPPPIITLVSPAPGSLVKTRTVNLAGSAGTAASVTVNGQAATVSGGNWTLANFDLGTDGAHALTIVGTSAGGSNTITPAPTITNDTAPPTIQGTITPAPNAANWNNSNVTVTFACSDTGSGIATCQAPITVSTEGAGQTVTGTAVDRAGNSATANVTVNLDKTAPHFTFTSHTNNQIVTTPQITVSGGSDDAINATINGVAATVNTGAKTFTSAPLTLVAKNNSITVSGKDIAGNTGTATINIIFDNIQPHVAITSPANNAVVSGDPAHVVVSGTTGDDQTSVTGVKVNDHPAALNADGTWTITLDLSAASSPATITVVATDAAGNTTNASISVVTIPPPLLSLISPAPGSFVKTRTVNLSGSAGSAATVTVNGQSATVSSGGWTLVNFDLGVDGPHTLTIVGTNAGGPSTITPSLTVDTTPPTITAAATPAANGAGWNNSDVTVTFTCSDSGSGIATCPTPITVSTEGASQTVTGTATDRAGNSATATVTLSIDKTPPAFTFTSHHDHQIVNTPQVVIAGGSDDAVTATVNGQTATIAAAAKTFTSPAITLTEGNNPIVVTGKDAADNSGTATITLNLDDITPHVAITSPANNATVPDPQHVVISGTASDDQTAVASIQVNGHPATLAADGTWTITLDLSAATSPIDVTAIATDAAGNITTTKITVITLPPPALTLTLPPPDSFVNVRTIALSGGAGSADSVTVNTQPATVANSAWSIASFDLGNVDGPVPLTITGTNAGGSSTITKTLFLDTVPPQIQAAVSPAPNAAGWNNSNVTVTFTCADSGSGIATCPGAANVSTEAAGQIITGSTMDKAGNSTAVHVPLNIDKTTPRFTFTSHTNNQIITAPKVTIVGGSDDAIAATVNGVAAVIDPATKTFTATLTLVEGSSSVTVTGSDIAGNSSSATLTLVVDTKAPQVSITSPAANACLNVSALDIRGTASDTNFKNITVQLGGTTVTPAVDASGNWVANFPNVPEGKALFTVTAADTVGHTATSSLTVNIDRTAPAIAFTESGVPFTVTLLNHAAGPLVRVTDADPVPSLTLTLDGAAYVAGSSIAAEGQHTLDAIATDCAGNRNEKSVQFTIDRTPPTLTNLTPANGAALGTLPASIQGTASEPATISVAGGAGVPTGASNSFTLTGVPFANGINKFTLHAVDAAGNASDTAYTVTVRTGAPVVTISDNGTPIVNGTLFSRAITPVVTADSADDTITATLDGSPFTLGTVITADGNHTFVATAKDPVGHTTTATVTFVIDRSAPTIKITSPAEGATIDADSATITGTAGDAVAVSVNGIAATISSGVFTANVPLDPASTLIVAIGRDAAGNQGRDQITVNHASTAAGIVLTYPPEGMRTNRPATVVTGRVLTPPAVQSLTLEGHIASGQSTGTTQVTRDPSGSFTVTNFALFEGVDTITATTTTAAGKTTSAIIHVDVDLTPPTVQLLAGGTALDDGAHFPGATTFTATAADAPIAGFTQGPTTVTLQIDGVAATQPATVTANGGHTAVAIATDGAGNQTRVQRAFFIGTTAGTAGCGLAGFDPADGSVVTANSTTLVGRSGGAAGVKINGIPAQIANGMFSGTVELSQEGANSVTIVCTDASGAPTGTPATITLNRVTAAPSITIDSPSEGVAVGTDTITVGGTVQNASSVDVNGAAATVTGSTYSVANVRLAAGLNILVAHAKNAAGAVAIASRRVVYLKNPPTISITWPSDGFSTGATTIDVSGTYTNLDPASLHSSPAGTMDPHPWSDTTGSFVIHGVPLAGTQAITVTGRDALNNPASVTVNVTQTAGAPSITITSPANNSYLPAGTTVPVTGTFNGPTGSQIDVNGTAAATADFTSFTYSGTAPFAASGPTIITAHLSQPDGNAAIATVIVNQLGTAPAVRAVFPDSGASATDPGVMVLVSFSAPMDEGTLRGAFTLLDASNHAVTGQFRLEKDVLSFAPATTLTPGAAYTIDIKTSAKDLAGNPLASEFTSNFTIATSAPTTPPHVNPVASPICASTVAISGTAPAGSRIEVTLNGVPAYATTDSTGNYTATLTIPQVSGYDVARVRIIGADGTFSPSAAVNFQVDCSGAQVLGATYDRTTNAISVTFSKAIDVSTVTIGPAGSTQLALNDGTQLSGTVAAGSSASSIVITPSAPSGTDPRTSTVILTITTAVKDTTGRNLTAPFGQTFTASGQPQQTPNDGTGYISGQILDATNGRLLAGASVSIDVPVTALKNPRVSATSLPSRRGMAKVASTSDSTGHYTSRLPEGAYAIHASANGYTDVYRQVVVPAGQGIIPIDIRLTRRGSTVTTAGSDLTLMHGGDDTLTRKATLTIPSAASGTAVTLTAVGGQGLPGLLPLGWSPLAAAEIHLVTPAAAPMGGATSSLAFQLSSDVAASGRAISAVAYDAARDTWDVIQPVVSIGSNGIANINVALPATSADSTGANSGTAAIALVYPDTYPNNVPYSAPPAPVAGGSLTGVADPCAAGTCPPFTAKSFTLNPPIVTPNQRTVATLVIDGSATTAPQFPSGTAIDALVNEELRLVDGSILTDQPFSTDLILYRSLDTKSATADFHLAPSAKASQVTLQIGFDHIQILPYPGRLDRGTLIGPAGGRVPSDEQVQINIPTGAATEALHATASSMTANDLAQFGSIDGFQIVGGFNLTLDPATNTQQPFASTQLLKSANATFTVDPAVVGNAPQLVLAEVVPQTTFGRIFRLADPMAAPQPIESSALLHVTTATINAATLPVDGIVRPGQYLLLLARQPIAFATGTVSLSTGTVVAGAAVVPSTLGVRDLSRTTGIYNVPVIAKPAAPFALTPLHPSLGEGVPYTATAGPDPAAIVPVGLTFAFQPPALQSVTVSGPQGGINLVTNNGASGISLSTGVQAVFSQSLDPASVTAGSITVTSSNGQTVKGTTTASGPALTWSLAPGTKLAVNSNYSVQISGTVRGAHGVPLGSTAVYTFSSVTQLTSSQINAAKIRITIPDANGISTIIGDAGALPTVPPEANVWSAIARRRGKDFVTQYQAQAHTDGSFSITIGTCGGGGNCVDSVTIRDHIDLEILNAAQNIAAIIPLTPFVTADGNGFLAPTDQTSTFTSKDGVTVTVPAGSFDQPTVVSVAKINDDAPFAAIPTFHQDMNLYGAVQLTFDCSVGASADVTAAPCESHKRIDLSIPTTVDPAGKFFLLGWLGQSVRGPKIMIVDTVTDVNGNLTTATQSTSQGLHATPTSQAKLPVGKAFLSGADAKSFLTGVIRGGTYSYVDMHVATGNSLGFAAIDALQTDTDMFWDCWASIFASHFYLVSNGGHVIIPVITGRPINVVGYDAGTGIQSFQKVYDPLPLGDPGAAFIVPTPFAELQGPYPVFTSPGRVEIVDLAADSDATRSIVISRTNFKIELQGGSVTVKDDPGNALDSEVDVWVLNVSNGAAQIRTGGSASVPAAVGDRIIILIGEQNVDAESILSVVFSKPIDTGTSAVPDDVDSYLHQHNFFKVSMAPALPAGTPAGTPQAWTDITLQAKFSSDSGGRRVKIDVGASLQRGATYRVELNAAITSVPASGSSTLPLAIGQVRSSSGTVSGGLTYPMVLWFKVRDVATLGSFKLRQNSTTSHGNIRDYALNGNVLFVSALDGGLLAYDAADPASLNDTASTPPLPLGYVDGLQDFWAVATDQHGRVYTTGAGPTFTSINSFRIDDFAGHDGVVPPTPRVVQPRSGGTVSWAVGFGAGFDVELVLSNRPQGIPRKLQLAEQDTTIDLGTMQQFINAQPAGVSITFNQTANGITQLKVHVPKESGFPYVSQRITLENTTRDMRWSVDAYDSGTPDIDYIVGAPDDTLRLIYNERTYGIVTIFGYGIGVFDLNAIESNDDHQHQPSGYEPISEAVKITAADVLSTPIVSAIGEMGCQPVSDPLAIPDLSLSPDVALLSGMDATTNNPTLRAFGLDVHRGALDDVITPPASATPAPNPCDDRAPIGLILGPATIAPRNPLGTPNPAVSPHIRAMVTAFQALANRDPSARFNGIATYHWRLEAQDNAALPAAQAQQGAPPPPVWGQRHSTAGQAVDRDYLLIPAYEFGLIVLDVTYPVTAHLDDSAVADVIWIPGGATGVRVIPRSHYATVVDGNGRVLIVDLSNIDQRWNSNGNAIPPDAIFKNAAAALTGTSAYGTGALDPRVVWISPTPLVNSTLPPVIDIDTGIMFAGSVGDQLTRVIAAFDPQIEIRADTGRGGTSQVGGVVPLGVDPPAGAIVAAAAGTPPNNASLGAFRLQITLPGGIAEKLANQILQLAVESERVPGAVVEQTPAVNSNQPFPRSSLRQVRPDGMSDIRAVPTTFQLNRFAPPSLAAALRRQKGFNTFVSPWIVAIADPRASISYKWNGASPKDFGCYTCTRPPALQGKTEADGVFEIWSGGRDFKVRPELVATAPGVTLRTIFDSTGYSYLAQGDRLVKRFPTIMGDTTRGLDVAAAAQNPPAAGGAIQETVLLHSGELMTSSVDLAPGGRAGWNVAVDRSYRSRTMLPSPFGLGWTSSLFRHLRALPNGSVEYRDETGEVFLFNAPAAGADHYGQPKGLLMRLARTDNGWQMIDMKRRISTFDNYGRLVTESDEFGDPGISPTNGNSIRYLYDLTGRLVQVIDPVNRATKIDYWDDSTLTGWKHGRVKAITDWRNRKVEYDYDDDASGGGRLTKVQLADVPDVEGRRPAIIYTPAVLPGPSYNDGIELYPELKAISDPSFNDGTNPGTNRVTFNYNPASGADRGKVAGQTWSTSDQATITYGATPTVTDARGHARTYTFTTTAKPADYNADRAHTLQMTDQAKVAPWPTGNFSLGIQAAMDTTSFSQAARTYHYGYNADGQVTTATLDGASSTTYGYTPLSDATAPGQVLKTIDTTPASGFSAGANAPTAGEGAHIIYTPQLTGSNPDGLYMESVSANNIGSGGDLKIFLGEPHRQLITTNPTNDSVTATQDYSLSGQLKHVQSTGGTDGLSSSGETKIDYYDQPADDQYKRGNQKLVTLGTDTKTSYDFAQSGTGMTVTETDESRTIKTVTQLDAWDRPTDVKTTGAELEIHQTYKYYASGQLQSVTSDRTPVTSSGAGSTATDTTSYTYDALGRVTDVQKTNAIVDGSASPLETKIVYDTLTKTTTTLPTGHDVVSTLDDLGRTIKTSAEAGAGSPPILHFYGYDIAGNLVYQSDNFIASEMAYDASGHQVGLLRQDGTYTTTDYDGFGNAHNVDDYAADGTPIGHTGADVTATGRVSQVQTDVGGTAGTRTTRYAWNGAGITSNVASTAPSTPAAPTTGNNRASLANYDSAGRLTSSAFGPGTLASPITNPFSSVNVTSYAGGSSALPKQTTVGERISAPYAQTFDYNTAGDTISATLGGLSSSQHVDQSGNVTSQTEPNRNEAKYDYDSRGALTKETLPDSKQIAHQTSALGVPTKYTDQVAQNTTVTDKDLIGRPVRREYADGTFEHFAWEGPRISTYTNRQGQTLTYTYYPTTGKLFQIIGSVVLDEYRYDAAGRVSMMRTPDAEIDIDSYDNEGHPLHVTEKRIINGTPSSALDQTYSWNAHGERTSWTMPRFGTPQTGWTDTVFEDHDEAGNVIGISRTQFGSGTSAPSVLLGAGFRNAGRPDQRTVTTSCAGVQVCTGGSILRKYGYNANAQMNSLTVTGSGGALAGSVANYEANGLQIHDVKILGLAGGAHYNVYGYDDRSRLQGAVLNTPDPNAAPAGSAPGTVGMNYTNPDGNADFLGGITRVPRLDAATRSALTAQGVDVNKIDPSGTTATPTTTGGHKIATFGPIGGTARTFGYAGSLVSDDGKYAYSWNEKEQLVAVTQKPATTAFPIRRFRYYYDGRGRVVGRRAQSANVVSLSDNLDSLQWQTETNPSLLAADGLPADTTFAWDMVSDQLIAVFNTNPSSSDPNAGLMRQIIHGGLTYDDPIEVTMPAGDLSGKLNRLYPVFDEAAAGSLQAVLNADAQLVARNLPDDPAGSEDVSFAGATIDRASIHATKDASGNLQSIDVTIHATEPLEPATLASGLRLASVNTNGVAVKTFTGAAQAVSGDAYSAKFTLSPTDWVTLNDPAAQALSIGVTPTLRAHGWASGLPILPPTEWAQLNGVFTTPALPVEIRDSLSSISTFVAAIGNSSQNTTTIYDVPSVALIGSTGDGADAISTLFTAKFQALPFSDPATGLVYARARWYSPETGTFLSGDPLAYRDSSNLYAFAAGDPVNGRDPTGQCLGLDDVPCLQYAQDIAEQFNDPRNWWGNTKRSTSFAAHEVKGAALAVPHLVKGIYDVATHLPETVQAAKVLAKALIKDPSGMAKKAGNALINVDSDKAGEFVGENLFWAGFGAAAKTTEGVAALRSARTALGIQTAEESARAVQRARVLANIAESRAARAASNFGVHAERTASVVTQHGIALQDLSAEALALRASVANGRQIFRGGMFGRTFTAEGQFWGFESALTPGYAESVGARTLGAETPDFVMAGRVTKGTGFVVRRAPAWGDNPGGAWEVVTESGRVKLDYFATPDP